MKIPTMPVSEKIVNKDGTIATEWKNFFDELLTAMQQNLSNEGLVAPSQSAANVAKLTQSSNGTLLYDQTNNEEMVRINGAYTKIVTA